MNPKVWDAIVPVIQCEADGDNLKYLGLVGTTFFIGKRGFAITAGHVVDQMLEGDHIPVLGLRDKDGNWRVYKVLQHEKHPEQDVGILLVDVKPTTWLAISSTAEHQSCEYDVWGYPIAVAEYGKKLQLESLENPELIYTRGYVRRRISRELPYSVFKGTAFYELSEIAGDGCSGSPVIKRNSVGHPMWEVIGIYVGASSNPFPVSYAIRSDSFFGWKPLILGRAVMEESLDR